MGGAHCLDSTLGSMSANLISVLVESKAQLTWPCAESGDVQR